MLFHKQRNLSYPLKPLLLGEDEPAGLANEPEMELRR